MIVNIIIGFIIPWLTIGVYLYKRDKRIIFFIVPFASVIAHTTNAIAYHFGFWHLCPSEIDAISALPPEVGYFSLLGGLFVYVCRKSKIKTIYTLLIFSVITTLVEVPFILLDKIVYKNGWNIYLTFFSYLIPYSIVYYFYTILKKNKYIS